MTGETRTPDFGQDSAGQTPTVISTTGAASPNPTPSFATSHATRNFCPTTPRTQAKIDEWLFWEQYSHEPNVATCRFHMHQYLGKSKETREPGKVERGEKALDLMDQAFVALPLPCGERPGRGDVTCSRHDITIADIALIAYTRLAHEGGFDLRHDRHLRKWIARCRNRTQHRLNHFID